MALQIRHLKTVHICFNIQSHKTSATTPQKSHSFAGFLNLDKSKVLKVYLCRKGRHARNIKQSSAAATVVDPENVLLRLNVHIDRSAPAEAFDGRALAWTPFD